MAESLNLLIFKSSKRLIIAVCSGCTLLKTSISRIYIFSFTIHSWLSQWTLPFHIIWHHLVSSTTVLYHPVPLSIIDSHSISPTTISHHPLSFHIFYYHLILSTTICDHYPRFRMIHYHFTSSVRSSYYPVPYHIIHCHFVPSTTVFYHPVPFYIIHSIPPTTLSHRLLPFRDLV